MLCKWVVLLCDNVFGQVLVSAGFLFAEEGEVVVGVAVLAEVEVEH